MSDFHSYMNDIVPGFARDAYQAASWDPEKRGEEFRKAYAQEVIKFRDELYALAEGHPERMEEVDEFFEEFRAGYLERANILLRAISRTASSAVVGRSNFPVRQNEKRLQSEQKWRVEYIKYPANRMACFKRHWGIRKSTAIRTEDDDAVIRMEAKIKKMESLQERMKRVNAIIRKAKGNDNQAREEISKEFPKLSLKEITLLLTENPNRGQFRKGYQAYEMSNNNANIKRCRERLAKLKRAKETQDQEFACQDDISVEISHSENRVKIFYPDKPDLETRQNLKSSGFRWAPSEGCWKGYVNRNTLNFVKPIVAASMASKPAI